MTVLLKTLTLKNPHSVLAALAARPEDVMQIRVNLGTASDSWKRVAAQASAVKISVTTAERSYGNASRDKEGRQGGAEALVREKIDVTLEQLFHVTDSRPGLWLALDCLQDPHNVGAVFRTAAFFGVRGIVLTKDRSAPMLSTVYDTAAGGVESVPFAMVPNLANALTVAKEKGVWVLGTSEHAERKLSEFTPDRNWLAVLGNEESGLRRLTIDRCDDLCCVPVGKTNTAGLVTSLNVSTVSGLIISTLTAK